MAENITNNKIITTVSLDADAAAQEIVKLNSLASDGTQELSSRLDAKNKQIEIQNNLNKKNISDLEKEVKGLKGVEGAEKQLEKAQKNLTKAKLNEVKVTEKNGKAQRKLADAYAKSKGAINKLDNATGGFITRLKLLATNPIVLFMTILVGAFKLLKEAFTSSEEGQNKWAKAIAVVNTVLGNFTDVIADVAEFLFDAFTNPVESIKSFGKAVKENISNRLEGLTELIPELGKAIGLLFDLEFSKAAEVAGNAVAKVGLGIENITDKVKKSAQAVKDFAKAQADEAKLSGIVADKRAEADKIERALIVRRSELESKIAENKLKARKEEDFTAKQRRDFLLEAQELEDELIDKESKYLILRRDAQVLENTFSRSNKENLTKEAEAIAAVNNQAAIRARKAKKLQNELNTVTKQLATETTKKNKKELAEIKAIEDFKKKISLAAENTKLKKLEEEREKSLEALELLKVTDEQKAQLKLDIEAKYKEDLQVITDAANLVARTAEEKEAAERLRIREEENLAKSEARQRDLDDETRTIEDKKRINSEYVGFLRGIGGLLRGLAGKNKTLATASMLLQKGAAIAGIVVENTATNAKSLLATSAEVSAYSANAAATSLIAPPISAAYTAAAVAAKAIGAKRVLGNNVRAGLSIAKIASTGIGRGSSGGGGGGGVGPTSSNAPTGVGTSDINNLSANNASRRGNDSSLSDAANAAALRNNASLNGGATVVFSEGSYSDFQNQVQFREDLSTIGG